MAGERLAAWWKENPVSLEFAIWRIDEDSLHPIALGGMDYEQRLQELVSGDLTVVDPGLMMIGREVATPFGGRMDILAIDSLGNLAVIELKRSQTPRDIVAQVLDYGSWVRGLKADEIANIYLDYQRRFAGDDIPESIDNGLKGRFGAVPDELNGAHRLIIVAAQLDPATERITRYLQEQYAVDVNAVFFRAFEDGDRRYLARAWMTEPYIDTGEASPATRRGEWNGEYYVSFGEGDHRRWTDARKYGFVSAGGGEWYVRTLGMLQPGDRIWVSVPGRGYVGVGEVVSSVMPYDEFTVDTGDSTEALTDVQLEAPDALDEEYGEHFVGVKWQKTLDLKQAVRERGFFGNQNTVARPRDRKWEFTVERLKTLWKIA